MRGKLDCVVAYGIYYVFKRALNVSTYATVSIEHSWQLLSVKLYRKGSQLTMSHMQTNDKQN